MNRKDYEALLRDCAPNVHHRFGGQHALDGERHDKESVRRWFGRLGRLAPGLTITVRDIWVKGLPNNTTIIIRWTATDTYPGASPYNNHGVHFVAMRWGKVFDIDANEESQIVAHMLQKRAEDGVEEATAPQIVS